MKKEVIALILAAVAAALLLMGALSGCATPKKSTDEIQTAIHDLRNEVKEAVGTQQATVNLQKDCKIESVTFGQDSFGFYTRCPNDARSIRKVVIKKSYPLVNGN
jgi:outer membrane murein-binding lipoprotein Lpp